MKRTIAEIHEFQSKALCQFCGGNAKKESRNIRMFSTRFAQQYKYDASVRSLGNSEAVLGGLNVPVWRFLDCDYADAR